MTIRTSCLRFLGSLATLTLLALPLAAQTPAQNVAASTAARPPLQMPAQAAPGFWGSVSVPLSHCKTCWHNCSLRKLLKNGMAPLSAATGGLIGGSHDASPPPPSPGPQLPPPPPPAVNAAAAIKMEAAQAEFRVDAVRYLATVDCHWYPEAEAALIASLRADRSECVRLAAAQSLNRGCCCTKKTVTALQICAAGSNIDGNPGERCPRVRWAALHALQTCLLQCDANHFEQPAYQDRPESPDDPLAAHGSTASLPEFYRQLEAMPAERLLLEVQQTVAALSPGQPPAVASTDSNRSGLYGIWAATRSESPQSLATTSPARSYAAQPASAEQARTARPEGYPLARPLEPFRGSTGRRGAEFSGVLPASAPISAEGYSPQEFCR
jgi:hypothetical protein